MFQPPLKKDGARLPANGSGSIKLIDLNTSHPFASVAVKIYSPAKRLQISSVVAENQFGPVHEKV